MVAKGRQGFGPHSPQEPTGFSDHNWHAAYLARQPGQIADLGDAVKWINGYDAGVRYADEYVGHLVAALKRMGLYDKTIIVIGADHGENLGELNVWGDHQTADEYTCNVPLIIRAPDLSPAVNNGLHYHFDWAATLIDHLGGRVPAIWDGRSFRQALVAGQDGGRDYLVLSQGAWAVQRGVRFRHEGEDWLFLRTWHDGYKDFGPETLFNLTQDPHETTDLTEARPEVVCHASKLLSEWWGQQAALSDQDVDPLMTVLREGGPYHTRGELPGYLEWLRRSGRSEAAAKLEERHPAAPGVSQTLR